MSKTGIDFVIGGKNNATPAIDRVDKQLGRLNRTAGRLERTTKMLKLATGAMMATWAAVKGIGAALGGINAINAAYDRQIEAVKGLEDSLRLNGEEVAANSARMQKFAADMQKLTGVGDEVTLGLMRQASMLGVSTEQLEGTSKAAIGLSEAMGKPLATSLDMVRRAQEGNFQQFERMFPQMRAMQTDAEKLAFVSELAAKGLDAKASSADRVSGMSERASGAMGDLLESVGALLAPVRMLWNQGIKVLAESLQTALVPAVQMAESVMANIGPLMDWVREKVITAVNGIIGAFTFLEVVVTNMPAIWQMMVDGIELRLVQTAGIASHYLTEVIPAYAKWFSENFINLVRDAFVGYVTIVKNSMTNAAQMVMAGWEWITSGMKGGISGLMSEVAAAANQSLLEGFEATTGSLPEIMERQISDREQQLKDRIGKTGADLGQQFADKFGARMIGLGAGIGEDFTKEIELAMGKDMLDQLKRPGGSAGGSAALSSSESRLLTRGPADRREDMLGKLVAMVGRLVESTEKSESEIAKARDAAEGTEDAIDSKGEIMFARIE